MEQKKFLSRNEKSSILIWFVKNREDLSGKTRKEVRKLLESTLDLSHPVPKSTFAGLAADAGIEFVYDAPKLGGNQRGNDQRILAAAIKELHIAVGFDSRYADHLNRIGGTYANTLNNEVADKTLRQKER